MSDHLRPPAEVLRDWFLERLAADGAPRTNLALFWHEVARIDDGPLPSPVTRGPTFLQYYQAHRPVSDVPGQAGSEAAQRPEPICRSILSLGAGQPDSLCRITFRFELSEPMGTWQGAVSRERFCDYQRTRAALARVEANLLSAFQSMWDGSVMSMGFQYGVSWRHETPGPRWRVEREVDGNAVNDFAPEPTSEMMAIYEELCAILREQGWAHIRRFVFSTQDPAAGLDQAQIHYY